MGVVAEVRRTLVDRRLVEPGLGVLVACSGGPDSAALLFALVQLAPELGLRLEAASVDHGLRPDAAQDVEVARAQAERVGVPFHALRVEVTRSASLQAAARDARYSALLETMRRRGLQRLATGHTRNDQAETVLLRLLRGSGVRGLAGIEPLRADAVIRPLIDCAREDVQAFAREHAPAIARDRSNDDTRFERVRVRQQLLPALEAEDASAKMHLARLAEESRELFAFLDAAAAEVLPSLQPDRDSLAISGLRALQPALRTAVLRAFLVGLAGSVSRAHLRQVTDLCLQGRGEVWLSADRAAVVAAPGLLRVVARAAPDPDATP